MLELALVGTPSSGKSTFFKAATLRDAKIAPYPFTTINPDEGIAHVSVKCPCIELNKNCGKCIITDSPNDESVRDKNIGIRFVPIKLWDIAGLVPDAHLGRGRGIAFLDDIRQAKALIQIIDISGKTDLEGNPSDNFDASKAVEMLDREITYWMFDIFNRDWKRLQHLSPKEVIESLETRFSGLSINKNQINQAISKSKLSIDDYKNWSEDQCFNFINELRKISKPSIIFANKADIITEPQSDESISNLEKLKQKYPEKIIISGSADIELALREASKHKIIDYIPGSAEFKLLKTGLDEKHKKALEYMKNFLEKNKSTGVQQALNKAVFDLLDFIVVYPVADSHKFTDIKGSVLPDAFLLRKGSTARDLAYRIHEDIGKKFISALDAKTQRNISADYVLKDGDIISIKSGR